MFFFVFFCWILICFEMQNTLILILLDHSHDAYVVRAHTYPAISHVNS